ncbi:MAG TPA: carbohydrate porin [Gemmatimonadales bacterium]
MAVIRRAPLVAFLSLAPVVAGGQTPSCQSHVPKLLGAQLTVIGQDLRPFPSPYSGPMSLVGTGDQQVSQSYGLYGGMCVGAGIDVYVDAEMVRGSGISHAAGLAAVTNGDVLRQGSVDLGESPYLARGFIRWTHAFRGGSPDTVTRAMDDLPRIVNAHRLEITAGRLASTDLFDLNRYANSTRTQFLNWVLFQNGAWDYAANTRGYSNGLAVAWINSSWTLRAGVFQMPRQANGNVFDSDLGEARGENVELTFQAPHGAVVRVLAYLNYARMGRYRVADSIGAAMHTAPNIVADDAPGRTKGGVGLNAELPLADGGETGVFARLGWNDGQNESFAFTEVDRHLSTGLQLSGTHWGRPRDQIGLAIAVDGLSSAHSDYLAAGGQGFLLGDGTLRYGPEIPTEAYYRAQLAPWIELSPDVQFIENPGYNRDRGPATVLTLRFNARY